MSEKKKSKPTNKKLDINNKNFLKAVKVYFSSMCARTCPYMYLNLFNDPTIFVISNADNLLVDRDRALLSKEAYHITFHILRIKDEYLYEGMKQLFNITFQNPYIIHLGKALSIINKCIKEKENIKALYDIDQKLLLTHDSDTRDVETLITYLESAVKSENSFNASDIDDMDDDDDFGELDESVTEIIDTSIDDSYAFGILLDEYRVQTELLNHVEYILRIADNLNNKDVVQIAHSIDLDKIERVRSNIYQYTFNLGDIKDDSGNVIYGEEYRQKMVYLIQDGLDMPSIGEFLGKCDEDWDMSLNLFMDKFKIFKLISVLKHKYLDIISMRPYTGVMPMKVKSTAER